MKIPERVRWAVDLLDPGESDNILEVGGGSGVSAALICEKLTTGRLVAIDRSAVAIERIEQRNQAHLAAGRLTVQHCSLDTFARRPDSFDKALALNVNLFWVKNPHRELAILSRVLRPGGRLYILYDTGGPTVPQRITALADSLHAAGFVEVLIRDGAVGTGVSARLPEADVGPQPLKR